MQNKEIFGLKFSILFLYIPIPFLASITSFYLKKLFFLQISKVSLILGIGFIYGFILNILKIKYIHFSVDIFFIYLLPIILANSCLKINKRRFSSLFFSIICLAFFSTAISFIILKFSYLFLIKNLDVHSENYNLDVNNEIIKFDYRSFKSSIIGVALCAIDPVVLISISESNRINIFNKNILSVLKGESFLNDIVALLLFQELKPIIKYIITNEKQNLEKEEINKKRNPKEIYESPFSFLKKFTIDFTISVLIGLLFGFSFAFFFKKAKFLELNLNQEIILILLQVYIPFLISEFLSLSGITSLLSSGIIVSYYSLNNVSIETSFLTKSILEILSEISENIIFVCLGLESGNFLFEFLLKIKYLIITLLLLLLFFISRFITIFIICSMSRIVFKTKYNIYDVLFLSSSFARGAASLGIAFYFENNEFMKDVYIVILYNIILSVFFSELILNYISTLGKSSGLEEEEDEVETERIKNFFKFLDRKFLNEFFSGDVYVNKNDYKRKEKF